MNTHKKFIEPNETWYCQYRHCSNASYLSCKRVVDLSYHIGYMYLWKKKWKNKTKSTTTSFITYLIEINFYNSEYINGIYMYTLIKRVWICSTNFLLMNFKQCWKYCFFKLFIIKLSLGLKETWIRQKMIQVPTCNGNFHGVRSNFNTLNKNWIIIFLFTMQGRFSKTDLFLNIKCYTIYNKYKI